MIVARRRSVVGAPGSGVPDARHSLLWQILTILTVLLVSTSLVVGAVTVIVFRHYLYGRLDTDLTVASQRTLSAGGTQPPSGSTGATAPGSGSDSGSTSQSLVGAPGQAADTVVAVYQSGRFTTAGYTDAKGDDHSLSASTKAALTLVPRTSEPVTRDLGTLGRYRVIATQVHGTVFISGLPLAGTTTAIRRLIEVIAGVALIGVIVAAALGMLLVRRTLRPLGRVADTASAVTRLELDRGDGAIRIRVPESDIGRSREAGQVGLALNSLLGRVSEAIGARDRAEARIRDFVADASHELRTPIATIRAYSELSSTESETAGLRRHALRIQAEAVRMGELVEELLLLAELDADPVPDPARHARAPMDLTALVADSVLDASVAGPTHRWSVDVDDEPVVIRADESQIRRLVLNLLANARVHTPAGTSVQVSVHRRLPEGADARSTVVVRVANDGPVIPPETLATVFERFAQGDASRSRSTGSGGLGLAIVTAIAEAHGGTASVTSEQGETAFAVELPVGDDL